MSVCGLWAKNFRKFGEVLWTFVKCIFYVTRWRMRVKTIVLKKVTQISSLAEIKPEKIGLSGLKIWQGFKLHSRCNENIFEEKTFSGKLILWNHSPSLNKNFLVITAYNFWQTSQNCTLHFQGNVWEKIPSVKCGKFHRFWPSSKSLPNFWRIFFNGTVNTAINVYKAKIWGD